jgi:hypothetical protein
VLAGERKSDLVEEARSDVYLDVLDDVSWWSVDAAVRAWFKHDCGQHDYKWAPDPGTLREIAMTFMHPIGGRIREITRALTAVEYIDCTKQFEAGRKAMAGLAKAKKAGLDISNLSFAEAQRLADEPEGASIHREAAE